MPSSRLMFAEPAQPANGVGSSAVAATSPLKSAPAAPAAASAPASAPAPAAASAAKPQAKAPEDASRLSTSAIHVIAQGVAHLPPLRDDAAAALAPDAEYRLREIVQDSVKFMRHAKRSRLTTGDVNAALRLRNVEALYGFGAAGAARDEGGAHQFNRVDGVADLFFVEDAEVNLKKLIEGDLPAVPLDYTVNAHWLAVDGVQPAIPQNPLPEGAAAARKGATGASDGSQLSTVAEKLAAVAADPVVKPLVRHFLGKELQLYFEHVTLALEGDNAVQRDACLVSLSEDPGLNQLLPYFTHHFCSTVRDKENQKNLPLLFSVLRLAWALLTNPHFDVEPYLHQILAPILTCVVLKKLCTKPKEDHWKLRVLAAELAAHICKHYCSKYSNVQPRITKTLQSAIVDKSKPLTTHYGAIVGLGILGFRVVDMLILPHIKSYCVPLFAALDQNPSKPKSVRRLEAAKVFGALAWAVAISVRQKESPALEETGNFVADVPMQKIDEYLPEFSARFPKLLQTFGEGRLYPTLVSTKAPAVAKELFATAPASSRAEGTEPRGEKNKK